MATVGFLTLGVAIVRILRIGLGGQSLPHGSKHAVNVNRVEVENLIAVKAALNFSTGILRTMTKMAKPTSDPQTSPGHLGTLGHENTNSPPALSSGQIYIPSRQQHFSYNLNCSVDSILLKPFLGLSIILSRVSPQIAWLRPVLLIIVMLLGQ